MSIAPTVETLLGASEPPPDAKLVRNGRYWIPPRIGEKAKGYTRVTTFAKTLEDTYNLSRWQQRMVLLGVAQRPDIQAGALADAEDKDRLNALAEAAMDAAKANVARETGTALHRLCERLDCGEALDLPDPWASDVAAYRVLLEDYGVEILPEYMEQVIVNNEVGVAGRFDRLVRQRGQILVGDLKGLALDTPIPTSDGWQTMGSITPGDIVFDSDGYPTPVLAKSALRQRPCYRIHFDDGSEIVADDEHRWPIVETRSPKKTERVVTTSELAQLMTLATKRDRRYPTYAIANQGPLDLPTADLPVDPYLLGVWLGDGTRQRGVLNLSEGKRCIVDELEKRGHVLSEQAPDPRSESRQFSVRGLIHGLRTLGLAVGDKRVPTTYLRASAAQRLELLQGLMDTDGSWNKVRSQITVGMTDKQMVTDICELVASLGWRWSRHEHPSTGFGITTTAYTMAFTPHTHNAFRAHSAKWTLAEGHLNGTVQCRRRSILAVAPTVSVTTQCIAVGGNHTFLCGEQMVPTHNTGADLSYSWGSIAVQLALYAGAESIYDPRTATHIPMPEVNQEVGLVFHLPSGQAKAAMYLVDLTKGREGIELIRQIRKWRTNARTLARTATEILAPLVTPEDPMPVPSSVPDATPVSPELRSYVEESVRGIIEAGFGEQLVARWPKGVPFLKASKDHFEVEVDEILAVVHRIEAEQGLAFPDYTDPRDHARFEAERTAKKAAKAASTNKRKALLD